MNKKIAAPILLLGVSCISAFVVLLQSVQKGETWRIAAASIGFTGFFLLNAVLLRKILRAKRQG